MSYEEAAMAALVEGVRDGRREAIEEAPTLTKVAGLRNPNIEGLYKTPLEIGPLPDGMLGVTYIKDGEALGVRVNSGIAKMAAYAAEKYKLGRDAAKRIAYRMGLLTSQHEHVHVQSSRVAKGEEIDDKAVDIMESITTYAMHKSALLHGKTEKAKLIAATNPYPRSWQIGEIADWAPYEGPSGDGYAAFIMDLQKEPFYKPLWRLTKASAKAAVRKGKEALAPRNYAPAAA
jgi:hypothetical protein